MKNKGIFFLVAMFSMALFFTGCSDDDAATVAAISGKVTYVSTGGESMDAAGAVINVYKGTTMEGESNAVVADETGMYKIEGLSSGDYYLVASYNTENVNNLKSAGITYMSGGAAVVVGSADVEQDIIVGAMVSSGTDVVSTSSGEWSKESHSKVTWKTLYHGEAATLAGGFGNFNLKQLEFDEANPTSTIIKGWVQLSSISTFEPGRDGPAHCVQDDLGVVYDLTDTLDDGSLNLPSALDASTDTAWFNSKTVEVHGNGYLAKGDLIFKGVTKEIDFFFTYNGQYEIPGRSGGSDPFAVFEGRFTFDAANDYNVDYSGGDEIDVSIHLQMKGPHNE